MNKIYLWIDQIWQWIAETVFVRFEFDLPKEALDPLVKQEKLTFTLTDGGLIEWLILSSWCRSQGLGAVLVSNRKRILLLAKPKYFFQILFRRKTYADLFLSDQDGPRLLFCPTRDRKKPFEITPAEQLLCEIYAKLSPAGQLGHFHLVPIFILWRKHLRGSNRSLSEYFFGLSSNPNLIGKMLYLFRARMDSTVRSLGIFTMLSKDSMADVGGLEDTEAMRIAKSTRRKILVLTQQEMRVVLGPRYHSPLEVKEILLRDPEIQKAIDEMAASQGIDKRKLNSQAYQILTEIVANQKYRFIEVMYVVLTWMFTRVFDGLVSRESEFQQVREIMKTKPVVFVPCHRSHLDYLVIPYVMFLNDMVPPHVAAGINLAFWPVGHFLRNGGAFFIRRSFRGDRLYTLCLKKYVEYLLKNRFNMKFFIEGTRSRSGKMLAPAYGMLKMTLEAYQHHVCDDIALIPVSLCYDEVPEQGAYTRELGGGQKEKESAKSLIKSKEIIKRNLGKVYVRLAPALYAKEIYRNAEEQGLEPTLMLQKTAFQLCKSINDVTPITPKSLVSSVILARRVSAVSLEEILRLSTMLAEYVSWSKLPLSIEPGDTFKRAVEQTVRRLQKNGSIGVSESVPRAYYCENRKRILLNFYKNNAIHCLVMPAITLLSFLDSLRTAGKGTPEAFHSRFIDNAVQLRNLLKFDFFFSPTPMYLTEIEENVGYFLDGTAWKNQPVSQVLAAVESHFHGEWDDISVYINLLGELLESYLTALHFIKECGPTTTEKKALLPRMVKFAETQGLQGHISFPESVSTQNYGNALLLFDNLKFLSIKRDGDKTLVKVEAWGKREDTLVDRLSAYLELMRENPETLIRGSSALEMSEALAPRL